MPRADNSIGESFGFVRKRKVVINRDGAPESAAGRARAEGVIEAEQGGGWLAVFDVAMSAVESIGKEAGSCCTKFADRQFPFAEMICLLAGLDEAFAIRIRCFDSILNNRDRGRLFLAPLERF